MWTDAARQAAAAARGAHASGIERAVWGNNRDANIQRAREFLKNAGVESRVYKSPRADAIAHATAEDNTVHLNAANKFWDDPAGKTAELGAVETRPGSLSNRKNIFDPYRGSYYSSSAPEHLLNHEMAHLAYADVPLAQNKFTPEQVRTVREKVSGYGAHNPTEFIAEVHAGMKAGKQYPDDIMQMFKHYAKPRSK